jgi:hypothetical protein
MLFSFIEVCMSLKLHVEMAYITMPSFLIHLTICFAKNHKNLLQNMNNIQEDSQQSSHFSLLKFLVCFPMHIGEAL